MQALDRWTDRFCILILAALLVLSGYVAFGPLPKSEPLAATSPTATVAPAAFYVPRDYALVDAINRRINKAITYEDDMAQYGVNDFWVSHPVSGRGDCEDYAITKIAELGYAGIDIEKVRMSALEVFVNGKHVGYHAVAVWTDERGKEWLLDNGYTDLMPKAAMLLGVNGTRYRFLW